jgi:hypothetical protein
MTSLQQFLIYQSEDGSTRIDVLLEAETLWLSQKQLTELFGKAKGTISEHIKHIFEDGEQDENSVVRLFRTTAADGKQYEVAHYNLDMVLALGFRVRSPVGVRFRRWANDKLKEFIVKGFVLDDARLKNPGGQGAQGGWPDYFDELIAARADSSQPNMGLTSWQGAPIRKPDVSIAKNYLSESELRALNNLAEQYLIFAEGQALRRVAMTMQDWVTKLEGFLTLNDSAKPPGKLG